MGHHLAQGTYGIRLMDLDSETNRLDIRASAAG